LISWRPRRGCGLHHGGLEPVALDLAAGIPGDASELDHMESAESADLPRPRSAVKQAAMTAIRVGIGGWVFPPWRGTFYPPGLVQARELAHASRQVTSIEINGTFYGSQKPASFRKWYAETPDDFVFSVKGPRYATHRRALGEAGSSVERFFASGVLELREKLGPILWQFAPTTMFDEANFAAFLELLPRTIEGRSIRHVVEIRHPSFTARGFIELLRRHGVALAFVDDSGRAAIHDITGDFIYARLRRSEADEPTGYSVPSLDAWAKRFRAWADGGEPGDATRLHPDRETSAGTRDCFVYFINGAKIRAPAAARGLLERLSRSA
jgi:uncharacterized protein YecE (DUF72 family)